MGFMNFRKMAEDKEFCQEILRVILGDDKLIVLESIPQWAGTNLQGCSVILDAKCIRGDGTQKIAKEERSEGKSEGKLELLFDL